MLRRSSTDHTGPGQPEASGTTAQEPYGTGWILSARIEYDQEAGVLELDQQQAIEKLAKKYGVDKWNKLPQCPLHPGSALTHVDAAELPREEYLSIIGSLLHISQVSRPDISHSTGLLARFGSCPSMQHHEAALRVVAYLYSTRDRVIRYQRHADRDQRDIPYILTYQAGKDDLHVFCDADFAGGKDSARSTTGYISFLNSGAVQWKSQLQKLCALSTMEAECVSLCEAIKEALSLKLFLEELGVRDPNAPVTMHEDNKSARDVALSDRAFSKARHYRTRVAFIQENCHPGENQTVDLIQTPTEAQLADGLTKTLGPTGHLKFMNEVTAAPILRTPDIELRSGRNAGNPSPDARSSASAAESRQDADSSTNSTQHNTHTKARSVKSPESDPCLVLRTTPFLPYGACPL